MSTPLEGRQVIEEARKRGWTHDPEQARFQSTPHHAKASSQFVNWDERNGWYISGHSLELVTVGTKWFTVHESRCYGGGTRYIRGGNVTLHFDKAE